MPRLDGFLARTCISAHMSQVSTLVCVAAVGSCCAWQVLQLIVMDEDLVGGGKVMGVAQMPLKQVGAGHLLSRSTSVTL